TAHDLRTGSGIQGHHTNGRIVHLRQCGNGEQPIGEQPGQQQGQHAQGGGDRTEDERTGNVHPRGPRPAPSPCPGRGPGAASLAGLDRPSTTSTLAPSLRRSVPSSTTCSPTLSPDRITLCRSSLGPTSTARRLTCWSLTTKTKLPWLPNCTAATGSSRLALRVR